MNTALEFHPLTNQLTGPVGSLPIAPSDQLAHRFLMLVEGECLEDQIASIAQKYGVCRQRYYQLRAAYKAGGLRALEPQKTGPKSNYRRTDQVERQVLRYRFLDPDASPAVITQKLQQTHFRIGQRSVQRVIADYGLQKKTLRVEPPKPAATGRAHAARRKTRSPRTGRRGQRGTAGPPTPGR